MAVHWSKTLIPTARQAPSDATVPSHQLMIRAGLIHLLGAGCYDYLPMGWRSLQKAMQIIREEMDAAGCCEILMPALQPITLWEQTGRRTDYGENLFVVKDRHGREQALGPTHEEVVTNLAGNYIESYKQLPLTLYQIQTKFRDEFRPRFGVLRSREFQMKDAYSFHADLNSLDDTYENIRLAYCRIFERCGVPYLEVEAEAGEIGGNASQEFMIPAPTGEDTILTCPISRYAANVEKAETGDRPSDLTGDVTGELEVIETPACPGIEDVVIFFKKELKTKLKPQNMLKTLICEARFDSEEGVIDKWVIAVIRADHELNENKLKHALNAKKVQLADEKRAREAGFAIGFVGPQVAATISNTLLAVDPDAAQPGFWVTGANEKDHHVKHFNWQRDVIHPLNDEKRLHVADIRNAQAGDPSPKDRDSTLVETKGIEVGHIFKLGSKYAKALSFTVLDEKNERTSVTMGCYGIGVNRILAGAIEREGGRDEHGIIWPASIAPFKVILTTIKFEAQMREVAEKLAFELESHHGLKGDVLIDDRDERPGVKFKDADLIGIPVRVTLGEKSLKDNQVEIKARSEDVAEFVQIEEAAQFIALKLKTL